jgi:hypothetical protein
MFDRWDGSTRRCLARLVQLQLYRCYHPRDLPSLHTIGDTIIPFLRSKATQRQRCRVRNGPVFNLAHAKLGLTTPLMPSDTRTTWYDRAILTQARLSALSVELRSISYYSREPLWSLAMHLGHWGTGVPAILGAADGSKHRPP